MKKRPISLILSLSLMLVLSPIALAVDGNNSSGQPNNAAHQSVPWVPLAEQLDLSDQQVQQLKDLNLATYQTTKPLKDKLHQTRFELIQLGLEKNADKAAVNAKIKEMTELKAQLHKIHEQNREKMQTILTPAQQSKLKAMKGFGHGGPHCKGCNQPKQ